MMLIIYGLSTLPPLCVAFVLDEVRALYTLAPILALCVFSGILMRTFLVFETTKVRPRMNYLTTTMIWLFMIAATSVAFYFGLTETTGIDAFFEAAAAVTTTGIGALSTSVFPYSFMLWRSILNWIGGVGMVLIAVSCISRWGFSWQALVATEVPGPEFLKTNVTSRKTYRYLVYIYLGLTLLDFVLLVIAGMDISDSVLTALSNVSTAGFQHINNGDITGLSVPIKTIITIFSFLGSINISFFVLIMFRKFEFTGKDSETVRYLIHIVITSVIIAAALTAGAGEAFMKSLGNALAQTVAYLSTAGYIVSDCSKLPLGCQVLILMQVFFGACALSTGGGIKISRVNIGARTMSYDMFRHIHPHTVKPVRFNGVPLKQDQLVSANMYIGIFMLLYICGALLLSLDSKDGSVFDALCYSQAMLTNTGTSIAEVSAGRVPEFSAFAKIIMAIEMLAGRLEIYPVMMLFSGAFRNAEERRYNRREKRFGRKSRRIKSDIDWE